MSGLGLSARAIRYAGESNHPHDPADLQRCVNYCAENYIDTTDLRVRMAGRSVEWDELLLHWDELRGLLADEIATRSDGCAPATYARMKAILKGARA